MNATFDVFWGTLKAALQGKTQIRNWTVDSGFIGDDFSVQTSSGTIHCDPPGVNVSKQDFESIWEVWEQYLIGRVKRKELRDLPHYNTKYVISILHHFMEMSG